MPTIRELSTVQQWQEALRQSDRKPLFIFKHSTRCNISADAYDAYAAYLRTAPNDAIDYTIVDVLESRPVSNDIAAALGVTHASPQAILVKDGKAAWHTSHWHITEAALEEHLK